MTDLADRRGMERTVYQPAEDTHLLASTVVEHLEDAGQVLDVGTGSGYVGATVAAETGATVIGTDVNPHACREARDRGLQTVRCDLVASFKRGSIDAVVCNPPYLPTDPDEEWDDWMELALSGGESGLAVIEPLIETVPRVLAAGGVLFVLVSSLTGVDTVVELADDQGFSAAVVAEESYPFETLSVLKLLR